MPVEKDQTDRTGRRGFSLFSSQNRHYTKRQRHKLAKHFPSMSLIFLPVETGLQKQEENAKTPRPKTRAQAEGLRFLPCRALCAHFPSDKSVLL